MDVIDLFEMLLTLAKERHDPKRIFRGARFAVYKSFNQVGIMDCRKPSARKVEFVRYEHNSPQDNPQNVFSNMALVADLRDPNFVDNFNLYIDAFLSACVRDDKAKLLAFRETKGWSVIGGKCDEILFSRKSGKSSQAG